jgi:hypothetical protein
MKTDKVEVNKWVSIVDKNGNPTEVFCKYDSFGCPMIINRKA